MKKAPNPKRTYIHFKFIHSFTNQARILHNYTVFASGLREHELFHLMKKHFPAHLHNVVDIHYDYTITNFMDIQNSLS